MKIYSKIGDGVFITLLLICLLSMFFSLVGIMLDIWIPAVVLLGILILFVIPIYFGTYYHIRTDALYINCGLFLINYRIDYAKIISMTDIDNFRLAPALSYHRVCIRYLQGEKIKSILISPSNAEKFKKLVHDQIDKYMQKTKTKTTFPIDTQSEKIIDNIATTDMLHDKKEITNALHQNSISAKKNQRLLAKLQKRMKNAENVREYQEMQRAVKSANLELSRVQNTSMFSSADLDTSMDIDSEEQTPKKDDSTTLDSTKINTDNLKKQLKLDEHNIDEIF
ncbi:MAG: PH domain-containing protein [Clostridia bacterium]|nr:PH domain-containing protein [Clostridia bacterium]